MVLFPNLMQWWGHSPTVASLRADAYQLSGIKPEQLDPYAAAFKHAEAVTLLSPFAMADSIDCNLPLEDLIDCLDKKTSVAHACAAWREGMHLAEIDPDSRLTRTNGYSPLHITMIAEIAHFARSQAAPFTEQEFLNVFPGSYNNTTPSAVVESWLNHYRACIRERTSHEKWEPLTAALYAFTLNLPHARFIESVYAGQSAEAYEFLTNIDK